MIRNIMILVCCVLLSLSAKAQQTFSLFPKAGDKYWQKQVLVAMRNDYIRLGNLYQKKPWNAIPAETFAEFRTNGNRTRYEEASYIYIRWKLQHRRRCSMAPTMYLWQICGIRSI